ncbi:MAG: hypothetical protein WB995_05590 [Candidatus Acidiferrales bacterium]
MFVGHYGPSFAAKAAKKSIPLWILFLAVQLLDVFWSIFVLLGVEKVRIVPGFTATNPLDLYYMPYTHSLVGALLWSIAAGVAYYVFRRADGRLAAGLVGAAVFSHWVLDWLVHRPDLPLYDSSFKLGLGLWNYPVFAFVLEIAILFGGMYFYLKTTRAVAPGGRFGFVIFGVIMFAIEAYIFFGPPPASDKTVAVTALVCYGAFAGTAGWLERKRAPRRS